MSTISIRPAEPDDFPAIRQLIHQAQINPTGLDWSRFLVAINVDGPIVGCGQVKPHKDGSLELASIVVRLEYRQQGVARQIIERLLEEHPGRLYLTCRSGLGLFYEKFGFEVVSYQEMPLYFKRISRLVNTFMKVGMAGESLLVMKREP
jgi:N-acetylglutamate synthase-like GNAT family acetyltransferase